MQKQKNWVLTLNQIYDMFILQDNNRCLLITPMRIASQLRRKKGSIFHACYAMPQQQTVNTQHAN